jgi:hypothetical protein
VRNRKSQSSHGALRTWFPARGQRSAPSPLCFPTLAKYRRSPAAVPLNCPSGLAFCTLTVESQGAAMPLRHSVPERVTDRFRTPREGALNPEPRSTRPAGKHIQSNHPLYLCSLLYLCSVPIPFTSVPLHPRPRAGWTESMRAHRKHTELSSRNSRVPMSRRRERRHTRQPQALHSGIPPSPYRDRKGTIPIRRVPFQGRPMEVVSYALCFSATRSSHIRGIHNPSACRRPRGRGWSQWRIIT